MQKRLRQILLSTVCASSAATLSVSAGADCSGYPAAHLSTRPIGTNHVLLCARKTALIADAGQESKDSKDKSDSPLKGSAKAIDVEAAESLRQMGDCLKKIERAGLELMGEATRQDYISVGDPDVIGTMIIPALPEPSGMMAVGPYLPVRAKWLDYYLDQIGKLIPLYAELTDSLVMPDTVKQDSLTLLEQMKPLFLDARERYMVLLEMSKSPKDINNHKLAINAVAIHDDMGKMDSLRKEVFKLLKEAEKEGEK